MSLNLDDDEEFWKWYQQQTEFDFPNPQYYQVCFGHYMKSSFSIRPTIRESNNY